MLLRLNQLQEGRFIIVTDHGNFSSYYRVGFPIFTALPNKYKIYGFIQ